MRYQFVAVTWFALTLASIPGHSADLPRSGHVNLASCWSGETHVITTSKTHTALGYNMMGTTRTTPPGGVYDMTTFECVGVGTIIEGTYSRTGYCNNVDTDGDKILGKYSATGDKGNYEIINGTGKYVGMKANLTFDVTGQFPMVRQGTLVGCIHATGRYTLP